MSRNVLAGATAVGLLVCGASYDASLMSAAAPPVAQTAKPSAPTLQVDPLWPRPLPNHWLFGSITGVAVDARDHIWVVHRGADSLNPRTEMSAATSPPTADECCHPAPAVLEFDQAGALVSHWGGPGAGYEWPRSPGGIAVDAQGNVWITAAGVTETAGARGRGGAPAAPRPEDAHILKFSAAGKFLLQIGQAGKTGGNDSKTGSIARRPSPSIPRPTRSTSPMASPIAASSSSTPRPEPTSGIGAPTVRPQARPTRLPTTRPGHRRSSSAT